ncbi:MAG TPA: response regulator [Trichocoleus sp.]|jgi:CheY-like chemotaxis protein
MNKRILIIDDEHLSIQVLEMTLKMTTQWAVLSANSGYDGIDKAKAEQPDAILLDMMMPGMNGLTTLSKLRLQQETQHIPVILLTSMIKSLQPPPADTAQAAAVMAKPFNPTTLAQQITDILGWS